MTNLVYSVPKYLPAEWHASNHIIFSNAERQRAAAERICTESNRLCQETQSTTTKTQQNNEHKLSQRIRDVNFWKQELEKKLVENSEETSQLLDEKKSLELALTMTQFPLEVTNRCLGFRMEREKIDLAHDAVEAQLIKEMEMIQGVQALLQKMLDQAVEQIRLLRSAKYYLEKDLTEKLDALGLDEACAALTDDSAEIGYRQQVAKIQTDSVTPDQWASFTNENILKTEKECNASSTLRGVIRGTLEQTEQDIERQRAIVDLEFSKRIHELCQTKKTLEYHLEKVIGEMGSVERNISQLQTAIQDKSGPMKLAQTRLDIRSHRPKKEVVRDPVQYGLIQEVEEITESVKNLQERLAESEIVLKGLLRNKWILEEDIAVKAKSLFIEQDQCMALRNQLGTN